MRNHLYKIILASSILFLISCDGKKEEASIAAPEGMHALDLSRYGKPFLIFVPDTVKQKLSVEEQATGALHITVGKQFAVSINEQEADLSIMKSDIKENDVNKLKQVITDEPALLVWESQITNPEFHFLLNNKMQNGAYSFEDIRDAEGRGFSKEAIDRMVQSCKIIQPAGKKSS